MSTAVISAVAEVKGVDPVDLDEQLYDYVDPGALDRLFRPDPEDPTVLDIRVTFEMAGCRVAISSPRKVVVTTRSDAASTCEEAI